MSFEGQLTPSEKSRAKNKGPRANLWVSRLQYRIINDIRGKMITKRTDVVSYSEVIQELLDNYDGEYS